MLLSRTESLRDDVRVVLTSGDELRPESRFESLGGVILRKPFSPAAVRTRKAIHDRTHGISSS